MLIPGIMPDFGSLMNWRRGKARLKDIKCNAFIAKTVLAGKEVLLAKPLTFMNRSGFAVKALLEHFRWGWGAAGYL